MARLIFAPGSALGHLFTIDDVVGLHGANHRKDVLLVQFFLRALISTLPGSLAPPLDGHCGLDTISWIRYFQTVHDVNVSHVREAAQRNHEQNNLKQIGVADRTRVREASQRAGKQNGVWVRFADGSVHFISWGSGSTLGGASNTLTAGNSQGIQDGTSNTILVGERPPANADPHVHGCYGVVRPPHCGEPFEASMTIVCLNRAYRNAFGHDRFKRIDLDPLFPRELFAAFYGSGC